MTHEEKVNYMRIACNVARIGLENKHVDLMVTLYELILEKKGTTDISHIMKAEREVEQRADEQKKQDLLDKVQDK